MSYAKNETKLKRIESWRMKINKLYLKLFKLLRGIIQKSKDKNIFEKQQLEWFFIFIIFFSYFRASNLIAQGLKLYYFSVLSEVFHRLLEENKI